MLLLDIFLMPAALLVFSALCLVLCFTECVTGALTRGISVARRCKIPSVFKNYLFCIFGCSDAEEKNTEK